MANPTDRNDRSAILLVHCPDRAGIVAAVTAFIHKHRGNILQLDQHVDPEGERFFMRVEWDLAGFSVPDEDLAPRFEKEIARGFDMRVALHFSDERPRVAIFVSRLSHCLYDVLARYRSGEWNVVIPVVVGNHNELELVARSFDIPFRHVPVEPGRTEAAEHTQLDILAEHEIDVVVLARYMQILSAGFVTRYAGRILNIHHSFLPAFAGGRPYHSAHARGVKIIGATSHYVTTELDAGPIIEQDVVRVSHRDAVADLVRKGRDLEKVVLARALWAHFNRKVLIAGNRTLVFE